MNARSEHPSHPSSPIPPKEQGLIRVKLRTIRSGNYGACQSLREICLRLCGKSSAKHLLVQHIKNKTLLLSSRNRQLNFSQYHNRLLCQRERARPIGRISLSGCVLAPMTGKFSGS